MSATQLMPPDKIVFVDCEATGLEHRSHPLSVGLAWCDGRSAGRLIRPLAVWSAIPWSTKASEIHGITRQQVYSEGLPAKAVADWMNEACCGSIVVSDNPSFDAHWLNVLFNGVGVNPAFRMADSNDMALLALAERRPNQHINTLVEELNALGKEVRKSFPHTHRAEEDALGLAMLHRLAAGLPLLEPDAILAGP